MEAENKPGAEAQEPHERSGKGRNILTAALLIALLGTWGYIIYDNNITRNDTSHNTTMIMNVTMSLSIIVNNNYYTSS